MRGTFFAAYKTYYHRLLSQRVASRVCILPNSPFPGRAAHSIIMAAAFRKSYKNPFS